MEESIYYITKLNSMAKTGRGSDGQIAACLLSHTDNFSSLSINKIAEETNTSYATVCRFFKKLGVEGMVSFKKIMEHYDAYRRQNKGGGDFDLEAMDRMSFDELAYAICSFSSGIVEHCRDVITNEMLSEIIRILEGATFIYFVGLGTSAITAQYAYTKFFRMEIPCSIDTDMIISKMKASTMKEKSVLFAVSSSGRTKHIVDVAKIAKAKGATVISLCDFANSPLSGISDISICTTTRESNKYIDTDFPLIQGQITVIDIIYLCYYKNLGNLSKNRFKLTKTLVKDDKIERGVQK